MLVLSRKLGERIVIGNDVVVTILEIRGESVKLGVDAPRTISVHRQEIYEEIRQANQAAMPTPASVDSTKAALRQASQFRRPTVAGLVQQVPPS
jgi:carbon storage regulator